MATANVTRVEQTLAKERPQSDISNAPCESSEINDQKPKIAIDPSIIDVAILDVTLLVPLRVILHVRLLVVTFFALVVIFLVIAHAILCVIPV